MGSDGRDTRMVQHGRISDHKMLRCFRYLLTMEIRGRKLTVRKRQHQKTIRKGNDGTRKMIKWYLDLLTHLCASPSPCCPNSAPPCVSISSSCEKAELTQRKHPGTAVVLLHILLHSVCPVPS